MEGAGKCESRWRRGEGDAQACMDTRGAMKKNNLMHQSDLVEDSFDSPVLSKLLPATHASTCVCVCDHACACASNVWVWFVFMAAHNGGSYPLADSAKGC